MAILIQNKRAKFDYQILESFQAGLSLSSRMVKAIRSRKIQIDGRYIIWQQSHLEIIGVGNNEFQENIPLLLKQKEIDEIRGQLTQPGISCVPLNIKTVGRWIKAEVALVKGKKLYNKKNLIKDRDINRDTDRELKRMQR